ncbi:MAG: prephenate dehydrogenase [Bacillota bacterium]
MSSSDGFTGPFRTIAIWGVGLIGGSIGMAIRQAKLAAEVIGIGREPLETAVALGAVDRYVTDPAEALAAADLLILAMPVGALVELAPTWGPRVRPGTVVTDVGSTKKAVVAAWEKHLAPGVSFVGGHPMFGREKSGVEAASGDLVTGCRWVLTPGPGLERMQALVTGLSAHPVVMGAEEHDRCVAGASHLPQLVATALAAAALELDRRTPGTLSLAAGGFRDTTRIAESPAALWGEIWFANTEAVREAVVAFRQALADLESAIEAGDQAALEAIFAAAHQARRRALGPR